MFINVFVLNTGRCGSVSFIESCKHITNYSSSHESLIKQTGTKRLNYPEYHIEADNRLSWFLGRLDDKYANDAFYVHLKRNTDDVAQSFVNRQNMGIMKAYKEGVLLGGENSDQRDMALDYINTVESNIELFLKDKTHKMEFMLENARADFQKFWKLIGADGNLQAALAEWDVKHNSSI